MKTNSASNGRHVKRVNDRRPRRQYQSSTTSKIDDKTPYVMAELLTKFLQYGTLVIIVMYLMLEIHR